MRRYHPFILTGMFTLLVTACVPGNDSQTPVAQHNGAPTTTPEISAPNTIISTDMVSLPNASLDTCPVTRPQASPFTPPSPYPQYPPFTGVFWHGTDALWTMIPGDGTWAALPHNPEGYTQKVFWWREDYSWTGEPQPQLAVTGRRLDALAPPLRVSTATSAFAEDIQSAMLVGVDFPTLGCWEITGQYANHELSFVVWVAP